MTRRRKLFILTAALGATVALAACGGGEEPAAEPPPPAEEAAPAEPAPAEGGALVATVGPGFTITLTTQDGSPVTELPAGTYTIEVDDESNIHDFHLTGPGVDEATDVAGTGTTTWTVELAPGEYKFVCDPHAGSLNGSFTVT